MKALTKSVLTASDHERESALLTTTMTRATPVTLDSDLERAGTSMIPTRVGTWDQVRLTTEDKTLRPWATF